MSTSREAEKLADYNAKRDFDRTAEPAGTAEGGRGSELSLVVQMHAARRLHYDLRLEWDGVLLSWAVTKGPSLDPRERRLAVRTEDHPISYGEFEGTIPKGEYGGGTVMLWDEGAWVPTSPDVDRALDAGKLEFVALGRRMRGGWRLVRMRGEGKRENWLLIKRRDDFASERPDGLTDEFRSSIRTGRDLDGIARGERERTEERARALESPAFREPQLATLAERAPTGEGWIHETKFDGYRCLVALGSDGPRMYTRSGKDWTDRFRALVGAFDRIECDSALIDGEVMARDVSGSPFSSLQFALRTGGALDFYAFDVLEIDGEDLSTAGQIERRRRLTELLEPDVAGGAVRTAEYFAGNGPSVYASACRAGAEGIISKRANAPYRAGRSKSWLKVKCTKRQEFVIGGYCPSTKRGRPFASLLVGTHEGGALRYRGRVGTGFRGSDLASLRESLEPRSTAPFVDTSLVPRGEPVPQWVKPRLVCEVEFTELTSDGIVRHGRFVGLRGDKPPPTIVLESAEEPEMNETIAGIEVSSPGREVFPDAAFTKGDLARHYERFGERMTAIAGGRPLSLVRCPSGLAAKCFYQRHSGSGMPDEIGRVPVEEADGRTEDYLFARNAKSFVAAAQMGTIEFHMWGARNDRLERPDRLVLDLDPDEALDFGDVRRAAADVRDRLDALGLDAGVLVTGGKGVHVWCPLRRTRSWETVKLFAKTLAHVMASEEPDRFVATMSKKRREGRIFIDWLRNERGATAVAPYSIRARPGAPVAVPVTWKELEDLASASTFTMGAIAARLESPCPYLERASSLQSLTKGVVDALEEWAR